MDEDESAFSDADNEQIYKEMSRLVYRAAQLGFCVTDAWRPCFWVKALKKDGFTKSFIFTGLHTVFTDPNIYMTRRTLRMHSMLYEV